MRASKQHALTLCAVLTALALLAPAAPDVAALWGAGHAHGHGAQGYGAHGAGWVHRTADHARHEASQLEPADPVERAECDACAGRSRSVVPLLLAPASATRQDGGLAILRQASHPVSDRNLRPGRPRAPPAV